ncbi:MAG: hypothetical protein H6512_08000 [Acidimicrobiia bacterium]|nr:hypothetical protein [Acidimicrobiia bacterium]
MTTDLHTRREATPDTDHPVVPDAEPGAFDIDTFEVLPSVEPGADPSETAPSNTVEVEQITNRSSSAAPMGGGPLARWERPALATLLLATGVLLLWG